MYESYLELADAKTRKVIDNLVDLLTGEDLLSGLTEAPTVFKPDPEFQVITNVVHAAKLCSEQPEARYFKALGKFCYTPEVLGAAQNAIQNAVSEKKFNQIYKKLDAAWEKEPDTLTPFMELVQTRYSNLGIPDSWFSRPEFKGVKQSEKNVLAVDVLQNHMYACFDMLLHVAFFGGHSANRYSNAIYKGFAAGGIPCGWLGATSFEKLDSMQPPTVLLHFGAQP